MFTTLPIETNISLAPFTTFKIGGPARYFFRAKTTSEITQILQETRANNIPVFILGGGSDILVHDKGFPGLVIKMENNEIIIRDSVVVAGAGSLLNAAIGQAVRAGLAGLEFATGVPASVGGAVWANLGCRGSEISTVVQSVRCLDKNYSEVTLSVTGCAFGYRDSIFKHYPYIILEATFQLTTGNTTELRQRMVQLTTQKKAEQNIGEDTAGCAFRNPSDSNKTAAQWIDELGLKGYQIGGAKVSERHANFILNAGGATADDVVQLISYIKQQVRDKAGVQLMEEVEYVGF